MLHLHPPTAKALLRLIPPKALSGVEYGRVNLIIG